MTTQAISDLRKRFPISPAMIAWLGFLGLCILIGLVSAFNVFWNGLYITDMSDSVPWGLWITIDLSSIALGAGAFTLSAVVYIFGLKRFKPIIPLAVFVGFIGYTCEPNQRPCHPHSVMHRTAQRYLNYLHAATHAS